MILLSYYLTDLGQLFKKYAFYTEAGTDTQHHPCFRDAVWYHQYSHTNRAGSKECQYTGHCGCGDIWFLFFNAFQFFNAVPRLPATAGKRVLEIMDHISIYFLIAGTYTPFLLIYLNNPFGITLLSVLWGLTVLGVFFKIFFTGRFEAVSIIIYIAMGWMLIAGGKRFFTALPNDVLVFIIIGGGLYMIGIIFYLWQRFWWHHAVWHFFVLAAAVCHYVAVLLAV